jgi:hypothetical protein
VPAKRWLVFIDDCGRFLDGGWAEKAAALGWGPIDLFGVDRNKPFARIDHAGLLWLLNGDKLIELDCHKAVIEAARATSCHNSPPGSASLAGHARACSGCGVGRCVGRWRAFIAGGSATQPGSPMGVRLESRGAQ